MRRVLTAFPFAWVLLSIFEHILTFNTLGAFGWALSSLEINQ